MLVFGASIMNKKRLRKQVFFIFSFAISSLSLTQARGESPSDHDSAKQTAETTSKPETPDIKTEDCAFISETYRKAISKHYIKELPTPEQEKQNPFDVRAYEELLQKLGVSDQSYYTQAGLKDDFENLRHPGSWKRLSKSEENRSQEIMARHLNNFRKCLDQSISAIKKEYSELSYDNLDPIAKGLFNGFKGPGQSKLRSKDLKSNNDIISYFNEKLNYYTGLCQKAHIPSFIAENIPLPAYLAFTSTWQQDHFGQGTVDKIKLKKATTNENPYDADFLQLNLIPKQIYGSNFEVDKKGNPYFRVSSCVTGECERSLEKTLSEINKDPTKKTALERDVYNYKKMNEEIEEAISQNSYTAQAFNHLKQLSEENGLEFSYDSKAGRITSDPRLFSEVLHKNFSEIQNEKDPVKKKELLSKHFPTLLSLQDLYGQQATERYKSYYGLEDKALAKAKEDQYRTESNNTQKEVDKITEGLKKQKEAVLSFISKKDDEEFHKALENPILIGESSSKKKSEFSFFPKKPEEIVTRSNEITRSINAISAKTSKLRAQKELTFHTAEISSLQKELTRIQTKREKGELLSQYEISSEHELARDIKLLLDKALPHLDKKDQEEARKSIHEWNRAFANKNDPKKIIEISRTWPIEKWTSEAPKLKTLNEEDKNLQELYKSYTDIKKLEEQQLANYELLQEKKPKTIIMGDQALIPISPEKASEGFKVIPAYGPSPQSLETQISEISTDLDKDLKSLRVAKLRYKGFKFDENSTVPLEQQIADQSESPLWGMLYGFADIGYGIKDLALDTTYKMGKAEIELYHGAEKFNLPGSLPIKAGPTSQKYLDNQFSTNKRIQETIEKARELGLPRHSLLQAELGLSQSMESLATDEKSNAAYSFALDSFYSDTQGNYKSAMGAIASLPLGSAASAGGRFLVNYARIARLTAAAEAGAGAATGLRGSATALVRAPVTTTAAQAFSEITLKEATYASAQNMGMLTMFSGGTTLATNINEAIQKRDASSLGKNWGHVIAGAFDPHMAIYAGFPALTEPLGKSAAGALANRGWSKPFSAFAEQTVHHGYWAYLGYEGASEQIKHLKEFDTHIAEAGVNFSEKREALQTGFITKANNELEYNPEEAQKQSAEAIQSIKNMNKEYSVAKWNAGIHALAGIGFPIYSGIRGVQTSKKALPAYTSRQALKEIGYKGEAPKSFDPQSLQDNPEIQKTAQDYLTSEMKRLEQESTQKIQDVEQEVISNKISSKKSAKKIEKITEDFEIQARAARVTADLAKGEYTKAEDHPLMKPYKSGTSTNPQNEAITDQNLDTTVNNPQNKDSKEQPAPSCGQSEGIKIDLKKP
jgi:hypothetical protein